MQNTGTEAQAQSIELSGLPDSWYRFAYETTERVAPGETRSGRLTIMVPPNVGGASYDFDISVLSGSAETTASGSIHISSALPEPPPLEEPAAAPAATATSDAARPNVSLEAGLVIWRGGGQAPERKALTIHNPGGSDADYVIDVEGLEATWYTVLNRVRVAAGEELQIDFTLHPPSGAREQDYPYQIHVRVEGQPDLQSEAMGWLSLPRTRGQASQPATSTPAPQPETPPPTTPSGERIVPPDVLLSPRASFRFTQSEPMAQAIVTVTNRGRVRERYAISINGIPAEWYRLSDDEVRLDPGESRQLSLRLNPVTGPGLPAGEYEFLVRALPDAAPDYYGESRGVVSVAGASRYEARLEPLQAQGLRKDFNIRVENTGDMAVRIAVNASDPENRCKFTVPTPRNIEPGQVGLIQVKVGAKRNGLVGPPETFDFRLRLEDTEGGAQADRSVFDGRFIHKPKLGYRPVFLASFVCALVAFVFLLVWLFTPTFKNAANWVGCKIDNNYRFAVDQNPVKKKECGGESRDVELEKWRQSQQSMIVPADEGPQLTYFPLWQTSAIERPRQVV